MPEVLVIETTGWSLGVWTREIEQPRVRLYSMYRARRKSVPATSVRFSPALDAPAFRIPVIDIQEAEPVQSIELPDPVFFENRLYEFEFLFPKGVTDTCIPAIIHPSLSVESSFRLTRDSLRGGINFGNDIGWFRLGIKFRTGGKEIIQYLSFEVLPLKMDLQGDFQVIHSEIDRFYPLWRFSLGRKTAQQFDLQRRPHEYFPLLWLSLFNSFRIELQHAVKVIVHSPHSRLIPVIRQARPESIKGRINGKLEEKIRTGMMNERQARYRILEQRLSVNTPENRFVKMVLVQCYRKLSEFKGKAVDANCSYGYERLSDSFFREIDSWLTELTQRLVDPLFREVDDNYDSMPYESIVLHHKTGYAKIYKIWQQLKLYLEFFGRESEISLKSVAELYEIWCLLEIRRMLLEIGFEEDHFRAADLINDGIEKYLKNGHGTAFHFRRSDGIKVRLAHEPLFPVNKAATNREAVISWTTPQKPDVLLEANFPDGGRIWWIFDAKYRIDTESLDYDRIPDDAINQMHRYRDALIHLKGVPNGKSSQSRPVVGAFVLYPGLFVEEENTNPYSAAIKAIGIGGFPLLPGRDNIWLQEYLAEKFGDPSNLTMYKVPDTDEHLLHESVRIPPSGLSIFRYRDLTLVAMTIKRNKEYDSHFLDGTARWYHMQVEPFGSKPTEQMAIEEIRYCALSVYDPNKKKRQIEFIYDVISLKKVRRSELTEEQAGRVDIENHNYYWLFELGASRRLYSPLYIPFSRKFLFRLTSLADIIKANDWNDLPDRYRLIYAADFGEQL